ncbi:unnamed protein product [Ascophyllum nodosum]
MFVFVCVWIFLVRQKNLPADGRNCLRRDGALGDASQQNLSRMYKVSVHLTSSCDTIVIVIAIAILLLPELFMFYCFDHKNKTKTLPCGQGVDGIPDVVAWLSAPHVAAFSCCLGPIRLRCTYAYLPLKTSSCRTALSRTTAAPSPSRTARFRAAGASVTGPWRRNARE